MAILSILVFGAALAASTYAIFATLRPELARIADLLANGPVASATVANPVQARSNLRHVRVRGVVPVTAMPQRAAA